jgi:hypothetical protein
MVKIFIYCQIPDRIQEHIHKYAFSYGLRYQGSKIPNRNGHVDDFLEEHNPVSIIPLSAFVASSEDNKTGRNLFIINESHRIPTGLDPSKHIFITILSPKICDIDNEKTFTTYPIPGNNKVKDKTKAVSGIYPKNTNVDRLLDTQPIIMKKHISNKDTDEIYLDIKLNIIEATWNKNINDSIDSRYKGLGYLTINNSRHLLAVFPEKNDIFHSVWFMPAMVLLTILIAIIIICIISTVNKR